MNNKKYWKFLKTGNHYWAMATEENKLCYPERRLYFTLSAFEKDFGKQSITEKEPCLEAMNPHPATGAKGLTDEK